VPVFQDFSDFFKNDVLANVLLKYYIISWTPVSHICNPSYSGGRDQEDCGSKSALANSSRPCLETHPSQKGSTCGP
jgi:hypothetical protein